VAPIWTFVDLFMRRKPTFEERKKHVSACIIDDGGSKCCPVAMLMPTI
jgi:hypothetical protein